MHPPRPPGKGSDNKIKNFGSNSPAHAVSLFHTERVRTRACTTLGKCTKKLFFFIIPRRRRPTNTHTRCEWCFKGLGRRRTGSSSSSAPAYSRRWPNWLGIYTWRAAAAVAKSIVERRRRWRVSRAHPPLPRTPQEKKRTARPEQADFRDRRPPQSGSPYTAPGGAGPRVSRGSAWSPALQSPAAVSPRTVRTDAPGPGSDRDLPTVPRDASSRNAYTGVSEDQGGWTGRGVAGARTQDRLGGSAGDQEFRRRRYANRPWPRLRAHCRVQFSAGRSAVVHSVLVHQIRTFRYYKPGNPRRLLMTKLNETHW